MPASTKDAEKDAEPPEVDAAEAEAAAAVVDTVPSFWHAACPGVYPVYPGPLT